ncbi:L-serine ammonia-lyase, iron-sulfur-dependent, subunit alpha [Clostridiaceae bacterium 35-E11]
MYEELALILKSEVKPALGCTGPTSVSYAVSLARDAIGGTAKHVKVFVDRDTYKNSIAVGIPGTTQRGVVVAAALGAMYGDSNLGLEVLKNVPPESEKNALKFAEESVELAINWEIQGVGLYIEAFVQTEKGEGHAIVSKTHTNVILIEANEKIIYRNENETLETVTSEEKAPIRNYKIKDFYDFAKNVSIESIGFLRETVKMNKKLVELGYEVNDGKGFGRTLKNFVGDKAYIKAKAYTAAASDARMAGKNFPAMSCASSGNVGITASLPLVAVAEEYEKSEEMLLRAISLSFLLTIYIKNHIGRLSAMCACAIAASIGVGAGTTFILDEQYETIEKTIRNIVGSIGGILCDGAKLGCALKLSSAVGVAIESAYLSIEGISIPQRDGIVDDTADETLALLGRLARKGMLETDIVMCKEIIEREKRSIASFE